MFEQQWDLGFAQQWLRLAVRSKVVALLLLYNSLFTVVAIVYGSYVQGRIQDFWKGVHMYKAVGVTLSYFS